jgi:hypothetical protein
MTFQIPIMNSSFEPLEPFLQHFIFKASTRLKYILYTQKKLSLYSL